MTAGRYGERILVDEQRAAAEQLLAVLLTAAEHRWVTLEDFDAVVDLPCSAVRLAPQEALHVGVPSPRRP